MIHLDTSFLIRSLLPGSDEDLKLRRWLGKGEMLGVSAIVWTEFLCGPLDQETFDIARVLTGEPEPFTHEAAGLAAEFFNASGRRRGSVVDCMVAAAASLLDASLATSNRGDFQRFTKHGLVLA